MIETLGSSPVLANGDKIPLSPAVRAGDFLFISGQLGLDEEGRIAADDVAGQLRHCVRRLRAVLALAGADLGAIVKTNVWLTDKSDFAAFNAAYREFFPDKPPARSTVVSDLLIPGARVEIDAVAYAPRRARK